MEKTLTSIYLDPSQHASFVGLDAVYRAVKEKGKNKISRKLVRDWLSQQDVYTLHNPGRRRYKRSRVIVSGIDAQFQADLVDLQNLSRYNKGYKYLLTCVDIFSKYAFVLPLKTKQGHELVEQWELPYQPLLLQTPQFNSSGCGLCGRRTNSPRTFVPEFSRRWWSKCDGLLSKSFLWNWKVFPGYGQSDK